VPIMPQGEIRVARSKFSLEAIWSALPQIADIGCSREDFSVGPEGDIVRLFEGENAVPVILHADDCPAVLFRLVVECTGEGTEFAVG